MYFEHVNTKNGWLQIFKFIVWASAAHKASTKGCLLESFSNN